VIFEQEKCQQTLHLNAFINIHEKNEQVRIENKVNEVLFCMFVCIDLREAFDLFDIDRDGRITPVELLRVMNALRLETSEQEIRDMITRADIDGKQPRESSKCIRDVVEDSFDVLLPRHVMFLSCFWPTCFLTQMT
jgi:Ca2+-binding EF-hand superfamily protein